MQFELTEEADMKNSSLMFLLLSIHAVAHKLSKPNLDFLELIN
jgi:hypothetical protein